MSHLQQLSEGVKNMSESSLHEKRLLRSDDLTKEERERRVAESLRRIDAIRDEDIDLSEMPEITDFSQAVRGRFYRPVKDQVTLRLDRDVLNWFKMNHEKYQTAINEALREHMCRQRETS
jgi:uncharacterized protein (DUF4415 family)